jgi:hypothetical protein
VGADQIATKIFNDVGGEIGEEA